MDPARYADVEFYVEDIIVDLQETRSS